MRLVQPEKCAVRRGRAWDRMRVIAACFVRALPKCTGRTYLHFLLIPQEVRAIGKTRNQFNTLRQRVSRLVRAALSFSKKLANHIGAIKLFICHYNLTRAAA